MVDRIEAYGATLVALSPQLPEHHGRMIQNHGLGFDLLSDPGNAYAAKLGLRFELGAELRAAYMDRGLDLPRHNGDDSWTLAVPARLVVDRGGIVRAVDADPDYTRRPEPDKTLDDLKALG